MNHQKHEKKSSDHSLDPDIFTGWKPNLSHHQFKQFPLYFTNPQVDLVSKSLTSFGVTQIHRVVYMGPRHVSNLKAFKMYSKSMTEREQLKQQAQMYGEPFPKYDFKYLAQKQKPFSIRPMEYRLFTGMNPTIKRTDLQFDSNFQCGNLDLAVLVNPLEYDLLMRVDSNTKGHTTWFYFKVSNFNHKEKIRFNLINFQKSGLLYNSGMKPYCFRSSKKVWEQEGTDVEFKNKKFRYQQNSQQPTIKKCLSWTFQFNKDDKYVYFAYCIPYSYSYLMHTVKKIQKEHQKIVSVNYHHHSTGGLIIPVLNITNPSAHQDKQVCLAIARLHPGQTQGSWMMDGFMKFLCSTKAHYLRQKIIFKIFPMVNVDGVVLGNFRTSIVGRDINRFFHRPEQYDEVNHIISIAQKSNPFIYLDFHGHSTKKNAFMYGPNYSIDHKFYLPTRLYPKIISKMTPAFRYYSCIFKISTCKINTSRAVMLRDMNVSFAYTIQASSFWYGPRKGQSLFNAAAYALVGQKITESLIKFLMIFFKLPKRLEVKQEKQKQKNSKSIEKETKKEKKDENISNLLNIDRNILSVLSEQKQLFQQLMNDEKMMDQGKDGENSDKSAQSDSDFEQGCDYSDKELKNLMKADDSDEFLHLAKVSKKKKNKKQQVSPEKVIKEVKSPLKKSRTKVLTRQKSFDYINKMAPTRQKIERKAKVISVQQISPPLIPESKSTILNYKNALEQLEQSSQNMLNRVHYKNWKKMEEPSVSGVHPYFNFDKVKPINHVTLSYCEESPFEEDYYEKQRKKELEMREKKGRRRLFKEKQMKHSKQFERSLDPSRQRISLSKKVIRVEEMMQPKESMLPILNKNNFHERSSNISFLEQLLEKGSTKANISYGKKNLRILHF